MTQISEFATKFAAQGTPYAISSAALSVMFPEANVADILASAYADAVAGKTQTQAVEAPVAPKTQAVVPAGKNGRPAVKAPVAPQATPEPQVAIRFMPANASDPSTWTASRLAVTNVTSSRAGNEGESLQDIARVMGIESRLLNVSANAIDKRIFEGVATPLEVEYVEVLRAMKPKATIAKVILDRKEAYLKGKLHQHSQEYAEKIRTQVATTPANAKPVYATEKVVTPLEGESKAMAWARQRHERMGEWAGEAMENLEWLESELATIKSSAHMSKAERDAASTLVKREANDSRRAMNDGRGTCGCGSGKTYRCKYAKAQGLGNIYGYGEGIVIG